MNRLVRNLVLSAAVAATALSAIPAAQAQTRQHRQMDDRTATIIGAGILGLAAGVIVGGIIANEQDQHNVRNPRPRPTPDRNFFPVAPEGGQVNYQDDRRGQRDGGWRYNRQRQPAAYEAWSPEWYSWCSSTYRSFNGSTGTYTTRGGEERFCVVR
jgi:hypothetical protein